VSRAAYDEGINERYALQRPIMPVSQTRVIGKNSMVRNAYQPNIEVNPQTFAVTVDGVHATVTPPKTISLNQLYFFS
jgi:urease subunit alpha